MYRNWNLFNWTDNYWTYFGSELAMTNNKKTVGNKAYSLWRVNGCQQVFHSIASLGFGGQKSASKPLQAICKTLPNIIKKGNKNCN